MMRSQTLDSNGHRSALWRTPWWVTTVLCAAVGWGDVTRSAEAASDADADQSTPTDAPDEAFDDEGFDDEGFDDEGFGGLDLEDLLQIEVTSVAGVARPLRSTPSAIHVITNEDFRRSGLRSIPEALRLVPGFTATQINAQTWGVGSRGGAGRFENQLLVLIDGRTVYDPLFSGVFWDVQHVMPEDIDRIEVIRGPGATLWGANAVSGVVNVVTKSARETQGLLLTTGIDSIENASVGVRYGTMIDDATAMRIWGTFDDFARTESAAGDSQHDDWSRGMGGARFDIDAADDIRIEFQLEAYHTPRLGDFVRVPQVASTPTFTTNISDGSASGAHARFRIARDDAARGWSLQSYLDHTERETANAFAVTRDTFDLEFRSYFAPAERHDLIWGVGFRTTRDRTVSSGGNVLRFDPAARTAETYSGFIQDTVTLADDALFAMVGTKLEHNDFSGFEVQPSARLWWTPNETNTIWGSVSRAIRSPARTDQDLQLITFYSDSGVLAGGAPSGMNVPVILGGDPDVESEDQLAFELGWRTRPVESVSIDLATYYNRYDDVNQVATTGGTFNNDGSSEAYGAELALTWHVADNWRVQASYTARDLHVHGDFDDADEAAIVHHQAQLHSYLDLSSDLELNASLYLDDRSAGNQAGERVRCDVGVVWRPTPTIELGIWGRNLLDDAHSESRDPFFAPAISEIERSVLLQARFTF